MSSVMPAEWERHEATWLAWPHNARDWPGKFAPIPWLYAEIVRRIAEGESVRLLVGDAAGEKKARAVLQKAHVPLERVQMLRIPTDRGWTRDSGPLFVRRGGERAIAHFKFNAWAKYRDWKRDARIPERAAKALRLPLLDTGGVVLEGGAIDVNGRGSILVTEECLLDAEVQVRNPGFGKNDYQKVFTEVLGAPNAIWLGSRPEVVALPMPQPVFFAGQRLPASYANFYLANAAVLVPVFTDPADRTALGILAELFGDRPVIGIPARDLLWGLGTLHCLSQQEPVANLTSQTSEGQPAAR